MLNVTHVLKGRGQCLVADFRIALLHAFNGLPHWQPPGRSDLQSIIVNRDLNARMVDIAAMYYRVDNQLSYGIRRNFIHVLPVHAFEPGAHMDVTQHILVGLFDKLLRSAGELTPIHEYGFGGSLKHAALHHGSDGLIARQNRISVGGHQLPVLFCQHAPLQQLFLRNRFDFCGVFGVVLRGFRQTCAQCFDVFFRYG